MMMSSQTLNTRVDPMRPRPRRACDDCRKRKRKCDGERPCSTCIRYQYTCRYEYSRSHRSARAAHTPLQMRPTERPTSTPEHIPEGGVEQQANFLERQKARFLSHASSVSQARSIGLRLGLPNPPRLHSFGYHTGVRKEPESALSIRLPQLLSWNQARNCIDVFTSVIHPVFGFMKMESICQRAQGHWQGRSEEYPFEAVLCGLIALGSLFSNFLDEEKELEIVLHAKTLLEDPVISRNPSQDVVMAWILRTIYSRATSRPNAAWLQSATTLHLIEITGVHYDDESTNSSPDDTADVRARITSVAQSLHIIIAYDYGKTCMHLDPAAYRYIQPRQGDFTVQLCKLTETVLIATTHTDPIATQAELLQAMELLMAAAVDHDFLLLARAELCFSIHRRLQMLHIGLHGQQTKFIVAAGTAALPAARRLAAQRHPWWNVTNTLFQFICICLSIGTTETLANLQPTIETFESIIQHFNTHLVQEAFNTALLLIGACQGQKEEQVNILQQAKGTRSGSGTSILEQGDWSMSNPQIALLLEHYQESPFIDLNAIFNI